VAAITPGLPLRVKLANSISGPVTIAVSGLSPLPVNRPDGTVLDSGDLTAGQYLDVRADSAAANFILSAMPSLTTSSVQAQSGNYVADTSTVANSIVVAPIPAVTAITPGLPLRVKLANSISGPVTITVSGLSPLPVKRPDGTALESGDLAAGQYLDVRADSAGANFILSAMPSLTTSSVQAQSGNSVADTSTVANSIVVAPTPAVAAITPGLPLRVKLANSISGPVTIAVSGLSAVPVKRPDGTALESGDLAAGQYLDVRADSAGANFILSAMPSLTTSSVQAQSGNYAADVGTANAYAVTLTPAPAALTPGLVVRFKVGGNNTGPSTLNVNGLGAVSIRRPDGVSTLIAGDLVAGVLAEVCYDGANFQLAVMASVSSNHHTRTTITSGSGTYTPPAGVKWLLVRLVGGGGGGAAAGVSPSPGGLGGTTTFGTSFLTAPGGGSNGQQGGYGGYPSDPPYLFIQGGDGANGSGTAATFYQSGGNGGSSPLGVGGVGGIIGSVAPRIGNGWGGGGGGGSVGATAGVSGGGGGAGAYVEAVITSLAASYSYAVGSGGLGGTNSGYQSGASGAPGVIIIDEYY
jgi:hypothetical protein